MTTKITVDAHAGWPVEVRRISDNGDEAYSPVTVQPGEVREIHVWQGIRMEIREMPLATPTTEIGGA